MTVYDFCKKLFFQVDAETMHHLTVGSVDKAQCLPAFNALVRGIYTAEHAILTSTVWGLKFPNPIGMGAGFDKSAQIYNPLFSLGFGFVEIGTVTPLPQAGNPKPRIFRLPADEALINRMGFNNDGVVAIKKRLRTRLPQGILGVNIGKNKDTPMSRAADDYAYGLREFYDQAHYLTVNISSPNTANLRALQEREQLQDLLKVLVQERLQKLAQGKVYKPILVKIAPDMTSEQLEDVVQITYELGLDGLIATNTTLERQKLSDTKMALESGGLSGKPVRESSTSIIRQAYQFSGGKLPIIGVGGIFTAQDALEKIAAGASLVQIYTGLIYQGPGLVERIKSQMAVELTRQGFESLTEAVGCLQLKSV